MAKIECNLTIGDKFINLEPNDGNEIICRIHGQLTEQELATVNVITQTLKCFVTQRNIDYYFNPTITDEDRTEIAKCEWMRSGRLVVRAANYHKRYQHATTVSEAMQRTRVFTCPRFLLKQLPRKRSTAKQKRNR